MMKNILFPLTALIILTTALPPASAQQYQPFPTTPATWNVVRCWYFFQPGWHDKYAITLDDTDTLYQGQVYKKLYITEHLIHPPVFDSVYPARFFGGIREANKQVYIFQTWASVDTTEHLVYDFTKTNIGDTIYTSALAGPAGVLLPHLVTGTDSVLIGQTYHKRLYLQDPGNIYNTEYWIEGVGSSWGLPYASFWSITDNSYDLTCYYKRQQFQFGNPDPTFSYCQQPLPVITCDSTLTAVSRPAPEVIRVGVYPNPTDDFAVLHIPEQAGRDLTVYFFTETGTLAKTTLLPEGQVWLDVRELNAGVYTLLVRSEKFTGTARLLVRR
ncbi:MAG: T9SS type A sorting domain-containing protein [Bacteroidetes bacterium]|nr:MAG: T9SS type A sorting domain-containing protein [Bacteroidota bacterium]